MFWSDSTHLTAFGQAKLWPAYMFLGNNSKYHRCCPTANLCNHVAYFQKLPSSFKDFATAYAGRKGPTKDLMAYCHREVFHAQWKILLDEDFVNAWEHGILISCSDGVTRRIYPRIFTYSADYPEKILIACIRNRGHCPCPRCLIKMAEIPKMGLSPDMKVRKERIRKDDHPTRTDIKNARSKIYADKGYAVGGDVVVEILKKTSLVPIENAFSSRLSSRLSSPGFDVFKMLVVDLLHEWELGVWRALLLQLIRLLHAIDVALVIELDRRYRQVPGFGHGVIRKFGTNVSELKRMAARDYEDLLQCSMPVFDGLFKGRDNHIVQDLLFLCCHWHALAKLRMHTDFTLKIFEDVTTALGNAFRKFESITCATHATYELPREAEARERKKAKKNAQKSSSSNMAQPSSKPASTSPTTTSNDDTNGVSRRRKKTFNMETYKFHSLPDYPDMIREYGTCDSYSTESGELEHRTAKARYRRTDRRGFIKQITQIERRQARIRHIRAKILPTMTAVEHIQRASEEHHRIGKSENIVEHISVFLQKESGNPGINDFIPKLKKHLLPRMRTLLNLDKTVPGDWKNILMRRDCMYRHNIMRVNYTSYDVRRLEDIVHPRTHQSNIMMLNCKFSPSSEDPEPSHPFLYAKCLGIFHINALYIEFLWVRYYDMASMGGWKARKLDEVRLASSGNQDAFGFVDPSDVLRACHLIPSFPVAEGSPVIGNAISYLVNRFVDRDMLMRYHWGLAVGHTYATMEKKGPYVGDAGDPLHSTAEHVNDEMDVSEDILVDNDRSGSPTVSNPYDTDSSGSQNSFMDDNWEDDSGQGSEDGFSSDGEFLAQEEMYGEDWD
ncbi:hypothetical protein FPV67DRAFT_1562486 [Lyophyllum atratum]|nr:hypothetical protein FPV67DRAFT_1562486 [Lyophyllum atratum]